MFIPLATSWGSFHEALRDLYDTMIPMCSNMIGVAKGIAGLGALFFIAYRVWKSLSNAEPIDVYPLLRPFVLGFCIMFFPTVVLGTINTVLSPVTRSCAHFADANVAEVQTLQAEKDRVEREAMMRNPSLAYIVDDAEFDRRLEEMGIWDSPQIIMMHVDRLWYKVTSAVQRFFRSFLEMLFRAAPLCVDTIRTFFLIVLSILGPLSFGLAVFDGFHNTLTNWLGRYIGIYLWLPIADILSGILTNLQILMLNADIAELRDPTVFNDEIGLLSIIFMIIGIVGYFCVPTISKWVVQAGGSGAYGKNINTVVNRTGSTVTGGVGAAGGHVVGKLKGR